MSLEIFARQVTVEDFLTQDEKSFYFSKYIRCKNREEKFNKNRRLSLKRQRHVFIRFAEDDLTNGWGYSCYPDDINFKVSTQVRIWIPVFTRLAHKGE